MCRQPEDLLPHYDVTISQPTSDPVQFRAFNRWLAEEAGRRGLSCALIHDGVVPEVIRRLTNGTMTIGYHLDYFALWHVADDRFARLSQAVQDAGGRPVNPPARRVSSPTRRPLTRNCGGAASVYRRP